MAQLIIEAKRYQYLAGLIKEEDQSAELDAMFAHMGKELAADLEDALEDKQLQQEVLATAATILGFILSAPVVGDYVGKAASYVFKKMGVEKGAKFGEWLSHHSHEIEHKFKQPIHNMVSKFIKDKSKSELVAEAIYAIIVAGLGVHAGMKAMEALKHADVGHAAIDLIKVATKGKDVASFTQSLI